MCACRGVTGGVSVRVRHGVQHAAWHDATRNPRCGGEHESGRSDVFNECPRVFLVVKKNPPSTTLISCYIDHYHQYHSVKWVLVLCAHSNPLWVYTQTPFPFCVTLHYIIDQLHYPRASWASFFFLSLRVNSSSYHRMNNFRETCHTSSSSELTLTEHKSNWLCYTASRSSRWINSYSLQWWFIILRSNILLSEGFVLWKTSVRPHEVTGTKRNGELGKAGRADRFPLSTHPKVVSRASGMHYIYPLKLMCTEQRKSFQRYLQMLQEERDN